MIVAVSSRLYLTHGSDYYESIWNTEQTASDNGSWLVCNCPVCHAEDFLAVEPKSFDYNPIITTLQYEYAIAPTSAASRIVVVSSLRAPPYLS